VPDTVEGVILLALLVLPGFILVGVSRLGRPPGQEASELTLVLRSFALALAIQVPVFPLWTDQLLQDAGSSFNGLLNHSGQAAVYALAILLLLPLVLGLSLRAYLDRAEKKVGLSQLDRILGARLPNSAWDILLRQLKSDDLLIVNLADKRTIAGNWGAGSFASGGESDSPSIYLSGLWAIDASGTPVAPLPEPWKGIWIPQSSIETMARFRP
jgi:hypothetical protein